MTLMFRPIVFLLLLFCAIQTSGVRISSTPTAGSGNVIEINLDGAVNLNCQAANGSGSEADEGLVWLRNGAEVHMKEGNNKGQSKVCVSPVIQKDEGANFTCHLRNNASVSAFVTLNVTYPPNLSGSEEVAVEEKERMVLSCDVRASPQVFRVSWTLNGSDVILIANRFSVSTDGYVSQLAANNVDRSLHQGTYQCTAHSGHGVHSKVFIVTVTDSTVKFPLMPIIAGLVVVALTVLFALASRWKKIVKCFKSK